MEHRGKSTDVKIPEQGKRRFYQIMFAPVYFHQPCSQSIEENIGNLIRLYVPERFILFGFIFVHHDWFSSYRPPTLTVYTQPAISAI